MDLSISAAFIGGLITFFSPCVLPLIPVYMGLVTGLSFDELKTGFNRERFTQVALKLLMFISGFTLIFVSLGATGAFVGQLLLRYKFYLIKAAGLMMILFGLYLLGVFRMSILERTARIDVTNKKLSSGITTAFLLGIVFGFAWSPCSGPILGSIILLASTSANVARGALLLFSYSLGIAVPLFISGILFSYFLKFLSRFGRMLSFVDKTAGALLLIVGLLFLTGNQGILYLLF